MSNKLPILNFQNVRIIWFFKVSFSDFQNPPKIANFEFSKCQNYLVFKMSFSDFQNPPKIANFGIQKFWVSEFPIYTLKMSENLPIFDREKR